MALTTNIQYLGDPLGAILGSFRIILGAFEAILSPFGAYLEFQQQDFNHYRDNFTPFGTQKGPYEHLGPPILLYGYSLLHWT